MSKAAWGKPIQFMDLKYTGLFLTYRYCLNKYKTVRLLYKIGILVAIFGTEEDISPDEVLYTGRLQICSRPKL
jgi:hypothetical protein